MTEYKKFKIRLAIKELFSINPYKHPLVTIGYN